MRFAMRRLIAGMGALALMTACAPSYRTNGASVGVQAGNGVDVYGYSPQAYGDWHTTYRQWTPTTVYEWNGRYYPTRIRGARQVQVYQTDRGYMMPPRDADFVRTDRRFNKKKLPTDDDYRRARPRPQP